VNEPPIDHILGVLAITVSAASTPSAIGGLAAPSQPQVRTDSCRLPMPAAITVSSI
jgi:hypothetical protein